MTPPLPQLILIADGFTEGRRRETVISAVKAGVRWVHLRDHDAPGKAFQEAATSLVGEIRSLDVSVRISSNQRLDVADALQLGYHGGAHGPGVDVARERLCPDAAIGWSAHSREEVASVSPDIVDYVFYSPIFPTSSKPGHPGVGLEALAAACAASPVPVFALGGVTPERVAACREAGAHGVAVLSGIMGAEDVEKRVMRYGL